MMLRLLLGVSLLLTSCGYHLIGQGTSSVIPSGVSSASLEQNSGEHGKQLLVELQYLWKNDDSLPTLQPPESEQEHIVFRIEQASNTFSAMGFDASGLAIQYRVQISGVLSMYQKDTLMWQSGVILSNADIYIGADPSIAEAERERLTGQLEQQWAQDAFARLKSGF